MYPSVITTFTNPAPTDRLNSPSHSSIESAQNNALTAVQTFVGTTSSSLGTLIYDIRSSNSDGGGHVQTAVKGGTGQTIYTKGDLLVGQSSSVLAKLAIGLDNTVLTADSTQGSGMVWRAGPQTPTIRVFSVIGTTSVLTYARPSVLSYLRVKIVGGGGGVGSGTIGGAGGGAAYSEKIIVASSVATTVTVVVGGALSGATGGTTAFGSIMTAGGGVVGTTDPGSGGVTQGANGGTAVGGDINVNGYASGNMSRTATVPAPNTLGGMSPYLGFGRGQSAAGGDSQTLSATGGIIIIEEY